MSHNQLANKEFFVDQLVHIDENIKELTNLYISSTPVDERRKHFFSLYVLELEELLKQNQKNNVISFFPKVFIGTKVTVMYEDDHETEDYVICFPEQSDPDNGFISFLSPVGRQLLLRKIGEQLLLKVPTGELSVSIKEISFAGDWLENKERQSKEA
ncbi:transcription elongation factor GreA [Bacillus oleivorans]|uniref:Transcription elongation factor GreA n=1 Tax=Bacillus oleivorans TaxID=1448271 RepID=A0A285CR68_9BACI|nr:GreA/GreB family elongation factor [Bacillus oleivorans]SNX69558.1 transcription elongation factor GreA [Bacillus oleivorans]